MQKLLILLILIKGLSLCRADSSVTEIIGEIPTGSVNGTNTVFTLKNTPVANLLVYRNGLRQEISVDYTVSGVNITFLSAPSTGEVILADYEASGKNTFVVGAGGMNLNGQTISGNANFIGTPSFKASLGIGNPVLPATSLEIDANKTAQIKQVQNAAMPDGNTYDVGGIIYRDNFLRNSVASDPAAYLKIRSVSTNSSSPTTVRGTQIELGTANGANGQGTTAVTGLAVSPNGNVLVGTTTDSGAARLQVNGGLTAANLKSTGGIAAGIRTAAANDLATASDFAVLVNGSESLPSVPTPGQILFLINVTSNTVPVSGNGTNIWAAGTAAASYSLPANSATILLFDAATWRVIK